MDQKTYIGDWIDNSLHGFGKLDKQGKLYIGYFEKDKKHGLGKYFYNGGHDNYLVGKFVENALYGLALHYSKHSLEKMVMMEKNKVKKTLNEEEIESAKLSDEYINLINFLEKMEKV